MLTASKTTLYVGALALRGAAILDRTVGHKLYFPMSACHVLNASRQLYHCHSPLLSPHIIFFRSCSMLCAYQCYAPPPSRGHMWGFELLKFQFNLSNQILHIPPCTLHPWGTLEGHLKTMFTNCSLNLLNDCLIPSLGGGGWGMSGT